MDPSQVTKASAPEPIRLLAEDEIQHALCLDAREGLTATPKWLPSRWLYDERGGQLFDQITELPEYYPTRTERCLLEEIAPTVASVAGAQQVVDLGSGSSEKTRCLLRACLAQGLEAIVAVDVDEAALLGAVGKLSADFPAVSVTGYLADFERHLLHIPRPAGGARLIAFLGTTVGNLFPKQRHAFLQHVAAALAPNDHFLLGEDLVKSETRLIEAYDDAAGVTAQFNLNILRVLNRGLVADFEIDDFRHVAAWNSQKNWIEMRLEARREHSVRVEALELDVHFLEGEQMRTEISEKFTQDGLARQLEEAGLHPVSCWTDPAGDFALSLSTPAG